MEVDYSKAALRRVLIITIILNLLLVIIKLGIGYRANSKALLADGLHSVSDVITTVGVIIGLAMSKKPRDEKHPYGHEKIETVSAFLLSVVLLYTGLRIGLISVGDIFSGQKIIPGNLAVYGAIASIIIKEGQYQYVFKLGKRINSSALIADAWHHRSDAFSSVAALLGIIGSRIGIIALDSIAAIVVSIIVIKIALTIFIDSFQQLIDVAIKREDIEEIEKSIYNHNEIININDIRTRRHGSKVFIDIRICVGHRMTVARGHEICEDVERIIKSKVKNVEDIVVHLDPCHFENEIEDVCDVYDCKNNC